MKLTLPTLPHAYSRTHSRAYSRTQSRTLTGAPRLIACWMTLLPALPLVLPLALCSTASQAQPLPERRPIGGRITGGDGAGVAHATVTLQRENDLGPAAFWGSQTATDAGGNFSFPEGEDGSYFISVEAEGYAPLQNKPLRVDAASSSFSARLDKLATLVLRLVKPDGTPLSKSRVLLRLSRAGAGTQPVPRQTDAVGLLTLRDQTPGTYSLEVAAAGAGFASVREVPVRFSGAPQPLDVRLQSGGGLKVTAHDSNDSAKYLGGAKLSLNATLEPSEADRRAGRLVTRSLADLQSLYAYSSDGLGAVTHEGDGLLELSDLPPGRYRVKLQLPSYAPSETREVQVQVGQVAEADFALAPQASASSLKLRLLEKDGQPSANREWTLQLRSLGPLPADLGAPGTFAPAPPGEAAPEMEMGGFGVLKRRARSNAAGEITLFPLRAGRWRVLAFPTREDGERQAVARADVTVGEAGGEATLNFEGTLR